VFGNIYNGKEEGYRTDAGEVLAREYNGGKGRSVHMYISRKGQGTPLDICMWKMLMGTVEM
jgi:hypothetical protein